jgi:hypothetical protein
MFDLYYPSPAVDKGNRKRQGGVLHPEAQPAVLFIDEKHSLSLTEAFAKHQALSLVLCAAGHFYSKSLASQTDIDFLTPPGTTKYKED